MAQLTFNGTDILKSKALSVAVLNIQLVFSYMKLFSLSLPVIYLIEN